MADNITFQTSVTATPPNATTVATDDVGGAQYQRVKIDVGGDGVSAPVVGSFPLGTLPGGTIQIAGTAQVLGIVQGVGTFQALGTFQPLAGSVHLASGTVSILGSVQTVGTVSIGTVAGTIQALGTVQPLAGSVHIASTGTLPLGTVQVLGSVQTVGTSQVLGSIAAQGYVAHGVAVAGNPVLFGGFGSSGTQAAVADGQAVRAAFDLNGRQIVKGTIETLLGTVQALGTVQPLAGSVHIASTGTLPLGSVQVLGSIQTVGTSQVLGSVQTVGTVSVGTIAGTVSVLGSVQAVGTLHVGSVQRLTGGTLDFLGGTVAVGTIQSLRGTIGGGTIVSYAGGFGSYFGTAFTAAVALGTIIAPPAQGTRYRLFDLTISASAAGTVLLQESASAANGTVVYGPLFFAANGGMAQPSARGLLARGTAQGLFASVSAGTVAITVNYTLES